MDCWSAAGASAAQLGTAFLATPESGAAAVHKEALTNPLYVRTDLTRAFSGRPARGLQALQIEVNRGLYMNERTYQRTAGFDALAEDLTRFIAGLMEMPAAGTEPLPLAAE